LDFIPAKESKIFIRLFRIYVKFLFKRRFKEIWIRQNYHPSPKAKTVYYLNHNSWWDGLIPLLLNEYCFHQKARALMEHKQMKRYPFFKKIGAFSINPENSEMIVHTLRYALTSMERQNASLYIYPEGKIRPAGTEPEFENGTAWLHSKLPGVDFVPVGIYIHTIRSDKPELHLQIGNRIHIKNDCSKDEKTRQLEESLAEVLDELKKDAGFEDKTFRKIF